MHTERIDVFDETYADHIILGVTNNFYFQFFPAQNRLFYKNLAYKAGLKTSCDNGF